MGVTTVVVLLVIAAALAAAAGVFMMTRRIRDGALRANEIIPGQATNAPASWSGSHDPEARLHRRIRDALSLLRSDPHADYDGGRIDARVRLEIAATELDNRLIAASKSPQRVREPVVAQAGLAVTELENLAAEISGGADLQLERVDAVIHRMTSPPRLDSP
ncbi:hypothetical protein DFR67_101546 [Williamsia limnetica]|uniref:Uncharacterized protein n=1 Tax=Williamsia limnetica TaxID=882452 RepID=A0A318RQI4_WILLI|nr:hypothetical protein DFR67_101546 [Williamsia limnetica]